MLATDDGRVVGIHHNSAERNGKQLDTGCCLVFELKDGRIIDGRQHFFDLYNWDGVLVLGATRAPAVSLLLL